MRIVSLIAIAASLVAGPASAQKSPPAAPPAAAPTSVATPLRPGLWEITVVMEIAGAPGNRTIVSRSCHAPSDVGDLVRVLPKQREPGMKCENREAKVQGANASWQVACASPEATLAGSAELSLAATTYSGRATLERKKRGAKAEKVTETLAGKWLEACK